MPHRVRAVNNATEAENKIHSDQVAARYGFLGGLVPGSTIFGYMMEPVLTFAPEWQEHGTAELRLLEPFYEGDEVIVETEPREDGSIRVAAAREDGTLGASAIVTVGPSAQGVPPLIAEAPLPAPDQRPIPSRETIVPGALLGSLAVVIEAPAPEPILQLSNDILVHNFRLGPWIHVASELRNWSAAAGGERVSVRGRVQDRFDKKGHEFVVAAVMVVGADQRLIQTVRHAAIYQLRERDPQVIP